MSYLERLNRYVYGASWSPFEAVVLAMLPAFVQHFGGGVGWSLLALLVFIFANQFARWMREEVLK